MAGYPGKQGRRPKPTALKIVEGNPGKRPLNKDEPVSPGEVKMPRGLTADAKKVWHRLAPILSGMKLLKPADVEALALLCETTVEYWDARRVIHDGGTLYEIEHLNNLGKVSYVTYAKRPEVKIAQDAAKLMKSLYVEFGFTPSARSRVKVEPERKPSDWDKWKGTG